MVMKKLVIILWLASIVEIANGQGFGAQILAGANFSQVDGDQLGGYNKLGGNLGVQIDRKISEDWTGAFEIRYSMKGAKKVIDPKGPPTFTLKLDYQYIEIPILVKYTKYEKMTLYAGPSLGVKVIGKRIENGIETEVDELNPLELGLNLGGTYFLTKKIGLDLRHSYSLLSVTDNNVVSIGPTWFNRTGWFNRLFTLGVIYRP
jgi:hypothetical protein